MPKKPESNSERGAERPRAEPEPIAAFEQKPISDAEKRERRQRDEEVLDAVLESLEASPDAPASAPPVRPAASYREDLYGGFASERRADGKIALEGDAAAAAESAAAGFRRGAKYMTNTFIGEPIAADYDIRTRNFSTQTRIAELPDGRKVFMVYDHKGSWLHRRLDGFMKWANGLKMRKVSRAEWKAQFEAKSTIPTIENDDPDTVIMPFHSNVNAHDVFARNAEIENFGQHGWAKEADLEEKLGLAGAIADEAKRIHDTGTAWGELILPNIILNDEKKPIVCDPEIRFDADVPLQEAKARDLKDLCISIAAALEHAHREADYGRTVRAILDRYADPVVIAELKKLASQKRGFLANRLFGYEQARTGVTGKQQYDAIMKAVAAYEAPEAA